MLWARQTHRACAAADSGNVRHHLPGPLIDPSQFSGQLPVSFTPIPDGRLLVLTADANTFSIDLGSGRCAADTRFRRGFRVGRAITFHAPSETLLITADGRAAAAAAAGTHCAATRTPSLAAWSLKPRSSPRLLASVKGARTDAPAPREFWRAAVSPDGRILAVCEPGGWSLMAGPDAKFQPLQVQREDESSGVGVSSLAWEDETNAVVAWGDGRVFRLDFGAMTSFHVPMRDAEVGLEEGSVVGWGYAGGAAAEAGSAPRLTVLEPAWEDGAEIAEVCYCGVRTGLRRWLELSALRSCALRRLCLLCSSPCTDMVSGSTSAALVPPLRAPLLCLFVGSREICI